MLGGLGLLYMHPRCWPETQTHGESVIVVSAALGAIAGPSELFLRPLLRPESDCKGRTLMWTAAPAPAALGAYPDDPLWLNLGIRGTARFLVGWPNSFGAVCQTIAGF